VSRTPEPATFVSVPRLDLTVLLDPAGRLPRLASASAARELPRRPRCPACVRASHRRDRLDSPVANLDLVSATLPVVHSPPIRAGPRAAFFRRHQSYEKQMRRLLWPSFWASCSRFASCVAAGVGPALSRSPPRGCATALVGEPPAVPRVQHSGAWLSDGDGVLASHEEARVLAHAGGARRPTKRSSCPSHGGWLRFPRLLASRGGSLVGGRGASSITGHPVAATRSCSLPQTSALSRFYHMWTRRTSLDGWRTGSAFNNWPTATEDWPTVGGVLFRPRVRSHERNERRAALISLGAVRSRRRCRCCKHREAGGDSSVATAPRPRCLARLQTPKPSRSWSAGSPIRASTGSSA